MDHILPEAHGGSADEQNLASACPLCNGNKDDKLVAVDPITLQTVKLFNPRIEKWTVHFEWTEGDTMIQGKTPTGRATVLALDMNQPEMVMTSELWVIAGWHPPKFYMRSLRSVASNDDS